jgi:hypothetical protein
LCKNVKLWKRNRDLPLCRQLLGTTSSSTHLPAALAWATPLSLEN